MAKKKRKKTNICKAACTALQKYARLRDSDDDGYGNCCSCGKNIHYKEAHGGHFQAKGHSYNGACLDERNVNLQCPYCNRFLNGNPAGYSIFMLDKYGQEVMEEIKLMSYNTTDRDYAEEMCKKYKGLCKKLEQNKNIF